MNLQLGREPYYRNKGQQGVTYNYNRGKTIDPLRDFQKGKVRQEEKIEKLQQSSIGLVQNTNLTQYDKNQQYFRNQTTILREQKVLDKKYEEGTQTLTTRVPAALQCLQQNIKQTTYDYNKDKMTEQYLNTSIIKQQTKAIQNWTRDPQNSYYLDNNQNYNKSVTPQCLQKQLILIKGFNICFYPLIDNNCESFQLCRVSDFEGLVLDSKSIYFGPLVKIGDSFLKNDIATEYEMSYDQQNNLKVEKFKVTYSFNNRKEKEKYRGLSKELADKSETDISNRIGIKQQQLLTPIIEQVTQAKSVILPKTCKIPYRQEEVQWFKYNQTISQDLIDRCELFRWLSNEIINVYARDTNRQNNERFWKQSSIKAIQEFKRIYVFDVDTIGLLIEYDRLCDSGAGKRGLEGIFERVLAIGKHIFDIYDIVFFPINKHNVHWFLMSARRINPNNILFEVYDSLSSRIDESSYKVFNVLKRFFEQFGVITDQDSTKIDVVKCSKQTNGFDCGAYVCQYIKVVEEGKDLCEISFKDIWEMRDKLKEMLKR